MGYDANIVNLSGQASLNTLLEHSINLVQELSQLRSKDAVSRMRSPGNLIYSYPKFV